MPDSVETGKTAYEIESELMGSSATRTGFGGRPEFINFYVDVSDKPVNLSSLPKFRPIDIDFIKCGKMIPIVTIVGADHVQTVIAGVAFSELEHTLMFIFDNQEGLVYDIETGEWSFSD